MIEDNNRNIVLSEILEANQKLVKRNTDLNLEVITLQRKIRELEKELRKIKGQEK